jgi:hypothetical protein
VKTLLGISLASLLAVTALVGGWSLGERAYADGVASVDAGPAPPAATGIATSPAAEPTSTVTVIAAEAVPTEPTEQAGLVLRLWKGGAIPAALIIAVWSLLLVLRRWVPWLGEGKRAVYLGVAVTFVGAFVERASAGSTPTLGMLLAAAATAVGAVMSPVSKAEVAK